MLQFFSKGWIFSSINSNVVTLVPKFVKADKIESFRPIALANFQFKIITKILADRLSLIAPKIISETKEGSSKVEISQIAYALLQKPLIC